MSTLLGEGHFNLLYY